METIDFEERGTDAMLAELYQALAEARSEFAPIRKSRTVKISGPKGTYSFDYAEFDVSLDATMPALSRHGLSVMQPVGIGVLRTIICHKGGARIVSTTTLPSADDIKTLGGYITYLKRYCYNALLCLAADVDMDDMPEAKRGEATATSQAKAAPQQQRPEATAPRPLATASAATAATPSSQTDKDVGASAAQSGDAPSQEQWAKVRELAVALGVTNKMQMNTLAKDLTGLPMEAIKTADDVKGLIAKLLQRQIDQKEGRT